MKKNLYIATIIILGAFSIVATFNIVKLRHQNTEQIKQEVSKLKKSYNLQFEEVNQSIKDLKTLNDTIKSKSKIIDLKHIEDEKSIDTRIFTDDDIDWLLTRFKK